MATFGPYGIDTPQPVDYDDDDDRWFIKRIKQNASTALRVLRVPVSCEEVSIRR